MSNALWHRKHSIWKDCLTAESHVQRAMMSVGLTEFRECQTLLQGVPEPPICSTTDSSTNAWIWERMRLSVIAGPISYPQPPSTSTSPFRSTSMWKFHDNLTDSPDLWVAWRSKHESTWDCFLVVSYINRISASIDVPGRGEQCRYSKVKLPRPANTWEDKWVKSQSAKSLRIETGVSDGDGDGDRRGWMLKQYLQVAEADENKVIHLSQTRFVIKWSAIMVPSRVIGCLFIIIMAWRCFARQTRR